MSDQEKPQFLYELDPLQGSLQFTHGLDFLSSELRYEMHASLAGKVTSPVRANTRLVRSERAADHLAHSDGLHVVSSKLKSILEEFGASGEYYPAEIEFTAPSASSTERGGGEVSSGYWLFHSWNLLDLVDPTASEIEPLPDTFAASRFGASEIKYMFWRRLSIRPPGHDQPYFGIKWLMGGRRFVSEALADRIRSERLNVYMTPFYPDPYLDEKSKAKILENYFDPKKF